MKLLPRISFVAALAVTLASANRDALAQTRYDWVGPVGVEANYKQGDLGAGEAVNWLNPGPPAASLQPDRTFGEYGSISNGGIAVIDSAIAVSPADLRIGELAGFTGALAIRNGGTINIQTGSAGSGTLANGGAGYGTLTLRDNMGVVSIERYTQNAASTLVTQLSGAGTFANHITASTSVAIDGTLRIERSPGSSFVAAAGNSWTIMQGAPVTGSFDAISVDPALRGNAGQVFTASKSGNTLTVNVEQRLVLQVDRFTGATKLVNPSGHAVSIPMISYTLTSVANGVSGANGRWNSLEDGGVAGWFEANPTGTQLSELNPLSSLALNSGQSRDLGTPINANPSVPFGTNPVNTADVSFQYQSPTGQLINAVIEPVGRANNLTLVVNPSTGSALIQNQSMQNLDMIGYTISSEAGSLKSTFAGMQGLPVANWFKANPTATHVSELNTGAATPLAVGAEFSLGALWQTAGNQRDLTFSYQTADGVLHDGVVSFGDKAVIVPANNADFNGNGIVDGTDFLTWQRGFGLTGQPNKSTGDANGDGAVNAADLTIWKTQFGTNPGAAVAAASVPEPATGALAVGALAGVAMRRRRASR
ncbi:dockerin type I domain-containing protein [Lacipirellula parvula]|uniref:Ice-binding protein C-terminal domain-containing protein n=1 Tax=Lacipirellula parvula TaxID=2650471 RepID=A0A5K7X3I0_9BACT|nr:dockerin type I domain-containing protein [Lacipirellula parvula]BBO31214.1 hypothetical protein PLANPX_0826 [Lacipirellula parvula]